MSIDPLAEAATATVQRALLAARLLLYAWLGYVLFQAIGAFSAYIPGKPWPFLLSILRTWTFLPIHEAGHLFLRPFGTTIMYLGGSLFQVLLPALWCALALKQRSTVWPFPLFWTGENLMDVSLYVRDAPVRALPLLGGHRSGHDWFNLLGRWDLLGSAETIADILFLGGTLIAMAALMAGIFVSAHSYLHPPAERIAD